MKCVLVLAVLACSFTASLAQARSECLPAEVRDKFETLSSTASVELQAAKNKLDLAKNADPQVLEVNKPPKQNAPASDKAKAAASAATEKTKAAVTAAADKVKEAEAKVKTQTEMADILKKHTVCPPGAGGASDQANAASTDLADLRSTVKWDYRLLILLTILLVLAAVLLCFPLQMMIKRIIGISEANHRILKLLNQIASAGAGHAEAASKTHGTGGQKLKSPPGALPQQAKQPVDGTRDYNLPPASNRAGNGGPHLPPPHGLMVSNGNPQPHPAGTAKPPIPGLPNDEDFDEQLNENEIWPVVLPIAGNLVETESNLNAASLTHELMRSVESSRPGIARKMRELGFQTISGRLAPDGRETSRNPEMFAVELSGRTLLFPSPRSKYKQSFDTYFEGASMQNWKNCLRPATVQKTGDNLLSVIDRGFCGG